MTTMTVSPMHESNPRVVVEPVGPRRHTTRRRPRATGRPRATECADSAGPSLAGGRLTRRGRLVVTMIWVVLVAATAIALVRPQSADPEPGPTMTVEVRPGDTLWSLATEFAPAADPRETIATILRLNGLESSGDLTPGDVLRVPAQ